MLSLTILPTISPAQINNTVIGVEPKLVDLGPPGEQFTVDIVLEDAANLIAWEFKLFWDNSVLELLSDTVQIPSGYNWDDPNNYQLGYGIEQEYSDTHGRYHRALVAIRQAQPYPEPFEGDMVLVTLTFNVIGSGGTALDLKDTKLATPNANSIPHGVEDGYVGAILWIEPRDTAAYVGYGFVVDVMINIQAASQLIGIEFKVVFDGTLVEAVNVTEGSFMKDPAWATEGTWFSGKIEKFPGKDYVIVGDLMLPQVAGPPAEWTSFPDGSGTLATITFEAKAEGDSKLDLDDTKLVNSEEEPITHGIADGFVEVIEAKISPDVNGDGFVDVFDIVAAAIAFGSYPGHLRWNPVADLNPDGIIDIFDIVAIALQFGTSV